jgi:hypothetical protein
VQALASLLHSIKTDPQLSEEAASGHGWMLNDTQRLFAPLAQPAGRHRALSTNRRRGRPERKSPIIKSFEA